MHTSFILASSKNSWVSRKVLILTACSAKQAKCPSFSTGSDAPSDSGTVYSLQTTLFLRKLCGLIYFLQKKDKKLKNRATVLVAVALSMFVGSGDLCWLCMVIRRPASPSPLRVALARGVCASGLSGSRTGPRGPPSPAAAEQWFSTFWGPPSGPPPPSPPLLSSLGHLGVQQQL